MSTESVTLINVDEMPEPLESIHTLLGNKRSGLAINFIDMKMIVRDPDTPANEFYGDPNDH